MSPSFLNLQPLQREYVWEWEWVIVSECDGERERESGWEREWEGDR